jgi:hypothetical protein
MDLNVLQYPYVFRFIAHFYCHYSNSGQCVSCFSVRQFLVYISSIKESVPTSQGLVIVSILEVSGPSRTFPHTATV